MNISGVWRLRWESFRRSTTDLIWIACMFIASELLIWGISCALALAKLQCFAAIIGMIVAFFLTTVAYHIYSGTDKVYQRWIRPKVDFINSHLGIGFPVPIVMLNPKKMLDAQDIGRISAVFLITSIISWIAIFLISMYSFSMLGRLHMIYDRIWRSLRHDSLELSPAPSESSIKTQHQGDPDAIQECGGEEWTIETRRVGPYGSVSDTEHEGSRWWRFLQAYYPIIISFLGILLVGIPVAAATHDERFLDGFTYWFTWISAVNAQRNFKGSRLLTSKPGMKAILGTMLNPVLMTSLAMFAYMRAKAAAHSPDEMDHLLQTFSSGNHLYNTWEDALRGRNGTSETTGTFGAGDLALAFLECGIVVWGFKIYQCRHQLFSMAGLLTVIICALAAAGNSMLCVLAAESFGLQQQQSLSFAARTATLALAKPSTEGIGGDASVNACLVVSNGIMGALFYPFVLGWFGIAKDTMSETPAVTASLSEEELTNGPRTNTPRLARGEKKDNKDSPLTRAAGVAIGINGSAMGVSYLYEKSHRGAPYATLAMIVFGVMTLVFMTVQPFKGIIIAFSIKPTP